MRGCVRIGGCDGDGGGMGVGMGMWACGGLGVMEGLRGWGGRGEGVACEHSAALTSTNARMSD